MGETFFSGEGVFFQKKEDPFPRPHPQESRFGNGRRFLFCERGDSFREKESPLSRSSPRKPHGFPVPARGGRAGTEQRTRIKKRPRPPPPSVGERGIKATSFLREGRFFQKKESPSRALPKKAAWVSCSGARRARRNGAAQPNKETLAPAAPFGRRTRNKSGFLLEGGLGETSSFSRKKRFPPKLPVPLVPVTSSPRSRRCAR